MSEKLISPNDIQEEFKNNIRQGIKELRKSNSAISMELAKLQSQTRLFYNTKGSFHAGVFSFAQKSKVLNRYYSIKVSSISTAQLKNLYEKCEKVVNMLLGKSEDEAIIYAIYYQDSNGKIRRVTTSKLYTKELRTSVSNEQLRLTATKESIATLKKHQISNLEVDAHFDQYLEVLNKTYKGKGSLPNQRLNRGKIFEAFERHLQNYHGELINNSDSDQIAAFQGEEINAWEAWEEIHLSMGNDPWYTGGDVGNIQVKSVIAGERGITSFQTIEDVINFLTYLSKSEDDIEVLVDQAYKIFKQKEEHESFDFLSEMVENDIVDMVKENLSSNKIRVD